MKRTPIPLTVEVREQLDLLVGTGVFRSYADACSTLLYQLLLNHPELVPSLLATHADTSTKLAAEALGVD